MIYLPFSFGAYGMGFRKEVYVIKIDRSFLFSHGHQLPEYGAYIGPLKHPCAIRLSDPKNDF